MASFLLDVPYKEGRDVNSYFPALRQWQVFAYGADNWQISAKLTVNLGLRWEYYVPPTPAFPGGFSNYDFTRNELIIAGVGGNPMNMGLQSRFKYFAPRLGIAYRLDDKTVIRTGFGISYTPFPDNNWAYNYPVRSNNLYTSNGNSYAVAVLPGGAPPTFQNGFPAPRPVVVPPNGIITNPDPTSAESVIPLNYRNGYVEAWNFAVQRALPWNFTIDVAYVGNHGVDTPAAVNLNAGQVIGGKNQAQPLYPITATITQYFTGFSSTYHSLQVKFDRGFTKGFRLTTAFTWQKAMDFQHNDDEGLDFYAGQGLSRNYARADFDRTLNFIQSYIYQLPFGTGRQFLSHSLAGKIIGGWQISGILSARTGTPLTITENNNLNLGSGGTATANQVGPVSILGGINIGNPWFDKSSFATSVSGVQGNMGRNVFSGPGLFSLNTNLTRTIDLTERMKLQLRLESLNVTNTPQFSNPETNQQNSNFSYITKTISSGTGVNGTGGGRVVQLGVKLTF
jgi:hypothetical protein